MENKFNTNTHKKTLKDEMLFNSLLELHKVLRLCWKDFHGVQCALKSQNIVAMA